MDQRWRVGSSTRAINPAKTREYVAAGLPVVSTRVPDVVTDYGQTVHLADDADEFAAGCPPGGDRLVADREHRIRHIKRRQEWDDIAGTMHDLMRPELAVSDIGYGGEATA